MKLKLDRFDPDTLPLGSITLCQGRRNTGKSTILKSLMLALKDKIDVCVAMTPRCGKPKRGQTPSSALAS